MPYPKKKRLISNMDGTFKASPKEKYKRKPVIYDFSLIDAYRRQRDEQFLQEMFTPEETKQQIREIWKIE